MSCQAPLWLLPAPLLHVSDLAELSPQQSSRDPAATQLFNELGFWLNRALEAFRVLLTQLITAHYKPKMKMPLSWGPLCPSVCPAGGSGGHSPQRSCTGRPGTGCQSPLQQQEMQMLFDIPEMNGDPQR